MSNTNSAVVRRFGKVVEMKAFGAIVSFDGKEDGLLHSTRMRGGSRPARNARCGRLAVGETVEVEVVDSRVEGGRRKLTLSERWHDTAVREALWKGTTVQCVVARVLDSGLIVTITEGIAQGVDGYVHVTELAGSEPRVRDRALASTQVSARMELDVLSTGVDEQGDLRIRLSQRAAFLRLKLASTFAPNTIHTGRVVRRTERGYLVSFGDFSGLLPENELGKAGAGSIRTGGNTRTKVVGVDDDGVMMLTRRGL